MNIINDLANLKFEPEKKNERLIFDEVELEKRYKEYVE